MPIDLRRAEIAIQSTLDLYTLAVRKGDMSALLPFYDEDMCALGLNLDFVGHPAMLMYWSKHPPSPVVSHVMQCRKSKIGDMVIAAVAATTSGNADQDYIGTLGYEFTDRSQLPLVVHSQMERRGDPYISLAGFKTVIVSVRLGKERFIPKPLLRRTVVEQLLPGTTTSRQPNLRAGETSLGNIRQQLRTQGYYLIGTKVIKRVRPKKEGFYFKVEFTFSRVKGLQVPPDIDSEGVAAFDEYCDSLWQARVYCNEDEKPNIQIVLDQRTPRGEVIRLDGMRIPHRAQHVLRLVGNVLTIKTLQ